MTHEWTIIRPLTFQEALWVDVENAGQVAEMFGGKVEVIRGITRVDIRNYSRPVGFWITPEGRDLNSEDWEEF